LFVRRHHQNREPSTSSCVSHQHFAELLAQQQRPKRPDDILRALNGLRGTSTSSIKSIQSAPRAADPWANVRNLSTGSNYLLLFELLRKSTFQPVADRLSEPFYALDRGDTRL
jgi:hypothetical protein